MTDTRQKRQQRPTNLTAAESAAWDSHDEMWDRFETIARELRPPEGFGIDRDEWRDSVLCNLETAGCDWLNWMMEYGGNVVGDAVKDAILRLSAEVDSLRRQLDAAKGT
jgi:hypothetical protein